MADITKLEGVEVTFIPFGLEDKNTKEKKHTIPGKTNKGKDKWGVKGQWEENGQTVSHLIWSLSELRDDMCGKAWVGDMSVIPLSNGNHSRYFEVKDKKSREAKPIVQQQKQQNVVLPPPPSMSREVRKLAVQKLLVEGYWMATDVRNEILADCEKKEDAGGLTGSFVEIWKCAIMSLKIDGNIFPDLLADAKLKLEKQADEALGKDEDIEAGEKEDAKQPDPFPAGQGQDANAPGEDSRDDSGVGVPDHPDKFDPSEIPF